MSNTLVLPKWKIWLLACRPYTLVASISPVIIGTLLSKKLDLLLFFFTMIAAIAIQTGTNLANDYFDYFKGADTRERKGPLRMTQSGLLSPAAIKQGFILTFCAAALCSLFLIAKGGIVIAVIAGLSILLGVIYTAGPYPIAYVGLSELFILTFFGVVATGATAYLQTGVWSSSAILAGMGPGSLSCCILTINNLRDEEQDRRANKKTLVVRFGPSFGKWQYAVFLTLALIIPLFFCSSHGAVSLTTILLVVPAVFTIRALFKMSVSFEVLFKMTTLFYLFYTLFFFLGWFI